MKIRVPRPGGGVIEFDNKAEYEEWKRQIEHEADHYRQRGDVKKITVPDGYNGHTVDLWAEPILDQDAGMVKLRVVGSDYLFQWVYRDTYERLPEEAK